MRGPGMVRVRSRHSSWPEAEALPSRGHTDGRAGILGRARCSSGEKRHHMWEQNLQWPFTCTEQRNS